VGTRTDSNLITLIYVGGKSHLNVATKFSLYAANGSIFVLIGASTMGLYGSNEPTLDFQILAFTHLSTQK